MFPCFYELFLTFYNCISFSQLSQFRINPSFSQLSPTFSTFPNYSQPTLKSYVLLVRNKSEKTYSALYVFLGLRICGVDCLMTAEWKSANKIQARTGPCKGKGDIIVVTRSGGVGSCTVQFRSYIIVIGTYNTNSTIALLRLNLILNLIFTTHMFNISVHVQYYFY